MLLTCLRHIPDLLSRYRSPTDLPELPCDTSGPAPIQRVFAWFSLRYTAHVATSAPLRCSRKPREKRRLDGRGVLTRLGMVSDRVSDPLTAIVSLASPPALPTVSSIVLQRSALLAEVEIQPGCWWEGNREAARSQ